jgi:hypothetical protein
MKVREVSFFFLPFYFELDVGFLKIHIHNENDKFNIF